ncbi:MAG: DUF2461 domain-containing protein [Saprospiraceae bacterium]|jgi:uncharacterized protein (TIGR02453 family)|nr:DUF2461 domain-containing protein [Saprospiraceae bacterium]
MVNPSTLNFLKELKENNNKTWFDEHRKEYENAKSNYLRCAGDILAEMQKIDSSLEVLNPKDCIFRINRDVRFSADKSPYKTNLGIVLHPHGKKFNLAAYYLHIEPGSSFVGGGLWMPESQLLQKLRKEISYFYDDLKSVLDDPNFSNLYGDLDVEAGQKLSRPPKGYEADDPAIEYLKLKSFTASTPIKDDVLMSEDMISACVKHFTSLKPFLSFINRGLMHGD